MLYKRKPFLSPLTIFALCLLLLSGAWFAYTTYPPKQWGKDTRKILLVGNSLTGYNNMPRMVKKMLNTSGNSRYYYKVITHIEPKYTLSNHTWKKKYSWAVYNNKPDIIFLQEHSTTFFYKEERLQSITAINHMIKVARYYDSAPRLLQTWPRGKNNDFYNEQDHEDVIEVKNPDEMAENQLKFYAGMAAKNHVPNVKTSAAWQCISTNHPEIKLYTKDDNHPTLVGSYLMALGVYKSVTSDMPRPSTWSPQGVTDDIKLKLFDCIRSSEISL